MISVFSFPSPQLRPYVTFLAVHSRFNHVIVKNNQFYGCIIPLSSDVQFLNAEHQWNGILFKAAEIPD